MTIPHISKSTRQAVFQRDGFKCKYCGLGVNEHNAQIDHIVPRSKGGSDSLDNLATACRKCNVLKSDRDLIDFISTPLSQQVADTWVKAYLRSPKVTSIISAIALIVGVASGIKEIRSSKIVQTEGGALNSEFTAKLDQLNETEKSLESLLAFVASQRKNLEHSQRTIDDLKQEQERLEPLVNSDRKVVESLFKEQELRNQESQGRERWIGFGLGVAASILASVLMLIGRFFIARARNA